ncbi:nickel transporter permease [Pseudoneobacillus rhizosphaerae]|uniref:D,D-dipeptide transport system permease protein DdpC n=1 Tax=Pseudoneobacillus rhizosphaerae TaxID=2880968 RepID=A0A9C7G8F1_9BACI|nr:nickel transporter permease [Pseudoneobacillus rhizosphaerae]CAG9607724.1 putative D,D-dipeptide transport system permease protein DdpC [Pseudoneobacillus rhizosphaerae]
MFRRLVSSPLTVFGFLVVFILVITALFAPLIATHSPTEVNIVNKLQPPSQEHIFGTDEVGRDIFSRIVHGTRISLKIGFLVVILSFPVGTILGAIAGYFGGIVDQFIMRTTDIFLSFPGIILAMSIAAALGPSIENVLLALVIVWWPWYTRIVRSSVLAIKNAEFIESARALGANPFRILFKEILPNSIAPASIQASLDFGFVILAAAGLSFIGLGAQPPSPEWGAMLSSSREILREAWWAATFPGLAILFTVLGFNLLGDGLRDILDPKQR